MPCRDKVREIWHRMCVCVCGTGFTPNAREKIFQREQQSRRMAKETRKKRKTRSIRPPEFSSCTLCVGISLSKCGTSGSCYKLIRFLSYSFRIRSVVHLLSCLIGSLSFFLAGPDTHTHTHIGRERISLTIPNMNLNVGPINWSWSGLPTVSQSKRQPTWISNETLNHLAAGFSRYGLVRCRPIELLGTTILDRIK